MHRYAIVDIETTGGHAKGNGITEIAVVITDGTAEIDRWETLIDPGHPIPRHITELTGIDDAMVESAPPFHAIADELEDFLADSIFVAHNVGFDYAFIRGHFEQMGRIWRRPKLCTVRLARQLLPGHASYSLGRLCRDLDIPNDARHRAMGDCAATVALFHRMMSSPRANTIVSNMLKRGERESWLPQHVPASDFEALPAAPGVYRFIDQKGVAIYVGMSHNVRHRVRTHFNGSMSSARRQAFLRDIHHIEAEATGSVLLARLREDELIRTLWPVHNRAQKSIPMRTAVIPYQDQMGRQRFHLRRQRHVKQALRWFYRDEEARQWINDCAFEHGLDLQLLGLGSDGREPEKQWTNDHIAQHNQAMNAIVQKCREKSRFAIIERGRAEDEVAVVLVENDRVMGWAYTDETIERFDQLDEIIPIKAGSATSDAIVQHALNEHQTGKTHLRIWQESQLASRE